MHKKNQNFNQVKEHKNKQYFVIRNMIDHQANLLDM